MRASQFVILLFLIAALPSTTPVRAQIDNAAALDKRVVELYSAGKTTDAIPLAKQSLQIREKTLPAGHRDIAISLNNLSALYRAQGRLSDAEPLSKRALELREKALPAGHPDIAASLNNLALLYEALGRL